MTHSLIDRSKNQLNERRSAAFASDTLSVFQFSPLPGSLYLRSISTHVIFFPKWKRWLERKLSSANSSSKFSRSR